MSNQKYVLDGEGRPTKVPNFVNVVYIQNRDRL